MGSTSKGEQILFVFEGKKTEGRIIGDLKEKYFKDETTFELVFDGNIYQLYEQMQKDTDFDIVGLLRERNREKRNNLENFNQDTFTSVYLFFDYDPQATSANDTKLKELLNFFNNDTENGLLLISYPMVEAIHHYHNFEDFKDLTVTLAEIKKGYKTLVQKDCPQLMSRPSLKKECWNILIKAHLCKMNYIVYDKYEFPKDRESQITIFEKQQEKYINCFFKRVAVLSAIPLFLLDYYGCTKVEKMLQ